MARDYSKNKRYSKLEKERLVARLLPPENITITELSNESGISKSTLSTWKQQAGNTKAVEINSPQRNLSAKDKFLTVMETYTLSEAELSRYCREKGLFVEDVKKWHNACINGNSITTESLDVKELKVKQQEDAKKIKSLEKDLYIREKALAETVSLLVLRKKLQAILVENVED